MKYYKGRLYGPYLCKDFPEPPEYVGKHRADEA